jgi:HSP20 family protein
MTMFHSLTNFDSSLLDDLWRMQQDMNELYGRGTWPSGIRSVARGTFPPINIGSSEDSVDVYVFASGINPESLDISIQQSLLTVAGERTVEIPENAQLYRGERFSGSFRRVISLPENVDPNKVDASYSDGILRIQIQRSEASKPRRIEIK